MNEKLSDYVARIMRQKNLSVRDVRQRGGNKITASYISRIVNNNVRNLSVDKLLVLAKGLEVDAFEIFAGASGRSPQENTGQQNTGVDPSLLLDTMQQALRQPDSLEVLRRWLNIAPDQQESVLKWVRFLSEQPQSRKQRKRRRKD